MHTLLRSRARRWFALALAVLAAACSHENAPTRPPSYVLITIDTLRRDHCSLYGYFRTTTPNLDAFAEDAVVFDRAYSTIATTLPSHLSMLTGRFVHEHGMSSNLHAAQRRFKQTDDCRSVADLLRSSGYTTAAFVSARTLHRATGVAAGFDVYDDEGGDERSPEETVKRAMAWLDAHHEKPFFLWVHLWGPHEPNQPPPPYDQAFQSSPELDAVIDALKVDPARVGRAATAYTIARVLYPDHIDPNTGKADKDLPEPTRESFRQLFNRYDGELLYNDHWLGELFADMKRLKVLDDAVVAIAADHGQGLGQHDWLDHGEITEENLRVPLVVRFPEPFGVEPRRSSQLASLVDLMPTLLAVGPATAREQFARQASGRDLLNDKARVLAFAQRPDRDRSVTVGGMRQVVIGERWKLVLDDGVPLALYDLHEDPGELVDVHAQHADIVERLAKLAPKIVPAASGDASEPTDQEQLDALRRLGYAGY